jgi:hypothetical protein
MMSHLDEVELVDSLDGSLRAERAAHLDACESCRDRLTSLRSMVTTTAADELPEPSPLFWEHFSRRVHDAVAEIDQPSGWSHWLRPAFVGWVTAAAVVAVGTAALWTQNHSRRIVPGSSSSATAQVSAPSADLDWNIDDDQEWALVRAIADDLRWEEAQDAGLNARPGSAERVALEMSADERQELARLIEFEMKRPGA